MTDRPPAEIPSYELPVASPADRARWRPFYLGLAAWARANGREPATVLGCVELCQKVLQHADDPVAVAAYAACLPAGFVGPGADPVRAASYFLNEVNGLDRETIDRLQMLDDAAGAPPAA